ncbi:hypothetical protein PGB90_000014 [Kerria lacca]
MDIRKFFINRKRKKHKPEGTSSESDENDEKTRSYIPVRLNPRDYSVDDDDMQRPSTSKDLHIDSLVSVEDYNENDIGRFIGQASILSTDKKKELLENLTEEIMKDATVVAEKVRLLEEITSISLRIIGKQLHRSNQPTETSLEFWKKSLIIPYLDSIITSLEVHFLEENTPSFALSNLHPAQLKMMMFENLKEIAQF